MFREARGMTKENLKNDIGRQHFGDWTILYYFDRLSGGKYSVYKRFFTKGRVGLNPVNCKQYQLGEFDLGKGTR
jgi:hypothetical protein